MSEYREVSLNIKNLMSPAPRGLGSECLDFGIEGFSRGICEPSLEIVDYCGVVVLEGLQDSVEFIIPESLHVVSPPGEIQSGDSCRSFLVEYVRKL